MKITGSLANSQQHNVLEVETNGKRKQIEIPARPSGNGSSVSGGELLILAIATCACNDLYREAARKQIRIDGVEVTASADFDHEGQAGSNFNYKIHIRSDAAPEVLEQLIRHVDTVAEVHNTLRSGVKIILER